MKKLLILAYDFPPYVSVGGLRPYNWLKYLSEFGVEPIVVTRHWENRYGNTLDYITASSNQSTVVEQVLGGTVLRTKYQQTWSNQILEQKGEQKYRALRKVNTAFHELRQYHFISGPKKEIYLEAKSFLAKNKVDVIIATGDPFVLFVYASKLSKEFGIPWIADYRDPWSQNKEFQISKVYHLWMQYVEKNHVSTASDIITVSDFLRFKLLELFPQKKIHVLPNGYDPEVIDSIASIKQQTKQLTISFVGTIYNWHPWKSVIEQYSTILESSDAIHLRFHFYGINNQEELKRFIETLPLKTQNSITIFPKIQNQELLEKLARENVMLLFNYYSFMGTKIFDYLGIKRKIILCYSNDEQALKLKDKYYSIEEDEGFSKQLQVELIQETNSGTVVENEKHLQQVLLDLIAEFNETGQIACHSVGVENYSRKLQVKKLADIVKTIV